MDDRSILLTKARRIVAQRLESLQRAGVDQVGRVQQLPNDREVGSVASAGSADSRTTMEDPRTTVLEEPRTSPPSFEAQPPISPTPSMPRSPSPALPTALSQAYPTDLPEA